MHLFCILLHERWKDISPYKCTSTNLNVTHLVSFSVYEFFGTKCVTFLIADDQTLHIFHLWNFRNKLRSTPRDGRKTIWSSETLKLICYHDPKIVNIDWFDWLYNPTTIPNFISRYSFILIWFFCYFYQTVLLRKCLTGVRIAGLLNNIKKSLID